MNEYRGDDIFTTKTVSTPANYNNNLIKSEKMVFTNSVWEEKLLLQT